MHVTLFLFHLFQMPTVSTYLSIYHPQCAAHNPLIQDTAGTVSLSGTTDPGNRTAFASTMVAALEMITDLSLRTSV